MRDRVHNTSLPPGRIPAISAVDEHFGDGELVLVAHDAMVSPVVLGDGKSLFRTAAERISLTQLQARSFGSGNVLLSYRPAAR